MPTSRPIFWHTITYSSPGVTPPVYLAGSFTEPPWEARGMQFTQRADGEFEFTQPVHIAPGREYQFKFRKGDNDWVLDQNITDSKGNQNNMLCVEWQGNPKTTKHVPGKVLTELGMVNIEDLRSDTPVEKIANTAAEVADTAQKLDQDDTELPDTNDEAGDYTWKKQEPIKTPLFAHESFGGYEFVDDGFDHAELDEPALSLIQSRSVSRDSTLDEVDINDPTIVKFPTERGSVMDVLRKVQSSSSQDNLQLPASPSIGSRKSSIDSTADESTETLSPASPTTSRRRENRLSHSSFQKTRSAASLGPIAEEPKAGESANRKKPRGPVFNAPVTPPSEEDDGVVMRDTKVTHLGAATANPSPSPKEQLDEHSTGREKAEDERSPPHPEDIWLDEPIISRKYSREKGPLLSECDTDCVSSDKRRACEQMDNPRTHAVPGNDRAALTTIGFITIVLGIAWWKGSRLMFR